MKGTVRTTTVNGKEFKVWSDFIACGTFAEDSEGNIKQISGGSYISNDLTVRKAIALVFKLPTFRK